MERKYSLTSEEEQKLLEKISKKDTKAREKLIISNKGLAYRVARTYSGSLPIEDLAQEGMIGIIETADKYNLEKGRKFSNYATYRIRHYILRALYLERRQTISISLEENVEEESGLRFHDVVPDKTNLERDALTILLKQFTKRILDENLSPRETEIMELRYGLNGEGQLKLEEIGMRFNLTRERINKIEKRCLQKLRACRDINRLRQYIEG